MCIIIFQLKISYMPLFFFWTWVLLEAVLKSLFIMFIVLGNSLFITFTSSQKPTVVNCDNSMKIWLNSTLTFPPSSYYGKVVMEEKTRCCRFYDSITFQYISFGVQSVSEYLYGVIFRTYSLKCTLMTIST